MRPIHERIQDIKNSASMMEVADQLGVEHQADGANRRKTRCPWHDDDGPSLKLYTDHAFCFGECKRPYDHVDLVRRELNLSTKLEAVRYLEEWLGIVRSDEHAEPRHRRNGQQKSSSPKAADKKRDEKKVVHTRWFKVRNTSGEHVLSMKRVEYEDGKKDSYPYLPSSKRAGLEGKSYTDFPFYGSEDVRDWPVDDEIVLEVEGEKSRDAAAAAGFRALSPVGGSHTIPKPEHLEALRDRRVVIWRDADAAGEKHARKMGAALKNISREVRVFVHTIEGVVGADAADHPAVVSRDPVALAELRRGIEEESTPWEPENGNLSEYRSGTSNLALALATGKGIPPPAYVAEEITDGEHYARDEGGKLYHYKDGAYRRYGERTILTQVKHVLQAHRAANKWSSHLADEVVRYIRADAPELWERPPLRQINLKNGIYDLDSKRLLPHDPAFLSAVQIPVDFDPEAKCRAWEKFVSTIFPADAIDLAYEVPAWLITPYTEVQKAILLTGDGSNGKSTYLEVVQAFVGRSNTSSLSLHKLETQRFAPARLVGRLANICPDLPSEHLASTSIFKAIVDGSGDGIEGEYKYLEGFTFRPFSRLVFSANHPPRSSDASYAFYRRWLVVPFERTFKRGEKGYRKRSDLMAELTSATELSGLLNRALEILPGLFGRGELTESDTMKEALKQFQEATDPLTVWLDRNTVTNPSAFVGQDDLRRAYNEWAEKEGKPGLTSQAFGRALGRMPLQIEKKQRTWKGESNARVYVGIGFKTPDDSNLSGEGPAQIGQRDQRDQRDIASCLGAEESKREETQDGAETTYRDQRVDRVEADDYDRLVDERGRELDRTLVDLPGAGVRPAGDTKPVPDGVPDGAYVGDEPVEEVPEEVRELLRQRRESRAKGEPEGTS